MVLYDPMTGKESTEIEWTNEDAKEFILDKYHKEAKRIKKEMYTKKDN